MESDPVSEIADANSLFQRDKRFKAMRQKVVKRNVRHFKLRRSNTLYFFNLLAIFVLQIVAIYFFKKGFLLSRSVLPNTSNYDDLSQVLLTEIPMKSIDFYKNQWGESSVGVFEASSQNLFEHELNQDSRSPWVVPKFKKAVFIIIDALRFDFVIPIDEKDPNYNANYHNHFRILHETVASNPKNSLLFKFLADPPTTTLQRLKGLTTGSLPTFIDAGSNFDGDEINEDNFIFQFAQHANRNVSLIGDDTWDNLFHPYLSEMSWPYESLNVWDIHTVDNGVIEHLFPLLDKSNPDSDNWQLLVGHFLGMDHVGHRYGPNNAEMVNKQNQMDREMKKLIDSIDNDTLLVIMGDHGMDQTGNHGGDSQLELESTLFLYSKNEVFNAKEFKEYPVVNQIDFVPSFSLLMGVPIPFNNLGRPINEMHTPSFEIVKEDFISSASERSEINNLLELIKLNYINILTLQRYKLAMIAKDGNSSPLVDESFFVRFLKISQQISDLDEMLGEVKSPSSSTSAAAIKLESINVKHLSSILDTMIEYQTDSLKTFKSVWAEFNNLFIYIGIGLLALSLFILILLAKIIPSVVFNQLITEFLTLIILMIFLCLIGFNATYVVMSPILTSLSFDMTSVNLLALAVGIVFGFLIIIFDRYNLSWLIKQFKFFANDEDAIWSGITLVFVIVVEIITYSSNSFLIFQDTVINFLLINFGIYLIYVFGKKLALSKSSKVVENEAKNANTKIKAIQGIVHSVSFVIIQKLNSLIRTCREEQLNHCPKLLTVTSGDSGCQTTNNFTLVSLGLLLLVSLIFPNILIHFMNLNKVDSYQNSAQIWIGKALRLVLFFNWVYWVLDYIEFDVNFNRSFFNFSFEFIKSAKLTIARTVMSVCLIGGNFIWSKGLLCIKLVVPGEEDFQSGPESDPELEDKEGIQVNESNKQGIYGLSNIYGSSYLLLILNFFGAILITNKPYSSISMMTLVYQIFNLLEIINLLDLRNNMIGPVLFNLLGYSYFYSTNHQITISSIKWELAFQLSDSIIFPLSQIPVILNSFGPFIITSLSVILITIWKIPPNSKPISLLSKIVVNCLTLLMSQTVITLSSLFFTNWFKRHLMVWKIFVPCFIFNSLILIVINVMTIFVAFSFGVTRLIQQINRIFGK